MTRDLKSALQNGFTKIQIFTSFPFDNTIIVMMTGTKPVGRSDTAGPIRNDIVNNPKNWVEDKYHYYNPQHRPDLHNDNSPIHTI